MTPKAATSRAKEPAQSCCCRSPGADWRCRAAWRVVRQRGSRSHSCRRAMRPRRSEPRQLHASAIDEEEEVWPAEQVASPAPPATSHQPACTISHEMPMPSNSGIRACSETGVARMTKRTPDCHSSPRWMRLSSRSHAPSIAAMTRPRPAPNMANDRTVMRRSALAVRGSLKRPAAESE